MNKLLSTTIFSLFMLLVLTGGIIAASVNPKVAYIYKSKVKIDQNVVNIFNELGLQTEFIKETEIPSDLSMYRFIFVGDEFFSRDIPVNKYQTILLNYNLVEKVGLVTSNGAGKLGSKEPLSVNIDGRFVTVYTKAKDNNGVSIPYYYIDNLNKAKSVKKVAGTYTTSSGPDFGDVISVVSKGENLLNNKVAGGDICFFGIIKSNYWTSEAKDMFKDCVAFVNKPLGSEIDCTLDTDCGVNHYIGAPSCTNNDIMQSYVSYTCNKPGQVESSCASSTISKLVNSCVLCSNGACQKVDCSKDSDCNDNNSKTKDVCSNPGTLTAKCVNTKIPDCSKDSECNDNNNQTIDSCINPGTTTAKCVFTIKPTCSKNLDCDDKNSTTEDVCKNPGTTNSICIHTLPGRIMILSFIATPTETSVKLDFSANLSDSASIVKKYKLKKNNESWIESTENSYIFNGLTPDTDYIFNVLAVDNSNKSSDPATISVRTLATPVPPVTPPVSSGGGGGSYLGGMSWCSQKWECSPWSECTQGIQVRQCSIPAGKCTPSVNKPIEKQSCITQLKTEVATNNVVDTQKKNEFTDPVPATSPSEESSPNTNPITGAAIAANIGKYSWVWIPVMLVGIIAAYYFLAGGRMRKVKGKA